MCRETFSLFIEENQRALHNQSTIRLKLSDNGRLILPTVQCVSDKEWVAEMILNVDGVVESTTSADGE